MINYNKYKKILENDLSILTSDLEKLGIQNLNSTEDWIAIPGEASDAEPDLNIASDRSEDWQVRRSTVAFLEKRYNNINRALQKIKDGTYGVCEICGEEIEQDRLQANPAARTNKAHINDEVSLT